MVELLFPVSAVKPLTGLVRSLRRWDLVAFVVNGVIGAGIFGLPSTVFSLVGSYSIVAFCVCAACVLVIVICFAEVASRYSANGGPYLYACQAYGPSVGFVVGWLVWMTRVTAFAANCNLLPAYLGVFFPGVTSGVARVLVVGGTVLALIALNAIGVRQTANASNFLAVGKLLPLAFFVIAGFFFITPSNFSFAGPPGYRPFSSATLLLVYAFTGFEMAVIPAGEAQSPRASLPSALAIGIGVVVLFYLTIQIVCIGTLPGLAISQRPLADAAARFAGYSGSALIGLGVVVSLTGNLNVILLSASRVVSAMGERGHLPRTLALVHPGFRTPLFSVLLTGAAMLALSLSGTFIYLLTISTLSRLITYLATCAALPVLRRRKDAPPALFSTPGGSFIAYLGVILCVWLLSNSTLREARDTASAVVLGVAIYLVHRIITGVKALKPI